MSNSNSNSDHLVSDCVVRDLQAAAPLSKPWRAELVGASSLGPDGVEVYEIWRGEYQRIAEHVFADDARRIVQCVNAHDDLVAALQQALDAMTGFRALVKGECPSLLDYEGGADAILFDEVIDALPAAIAKATRT